MEAAVPFKLLPARLTSLPDDDHVWRTEWLGRIALSARKPSEHLINLLLRRIETSLAGLTAPPATSTAIERLVRVPIGLLPAIAIGSLWKRRELIGIHKYEQREYRELNFENNTLSVIRADTRTADGAGYVIPPYVYAIGQDGLHTYLLAIRTRQAILYVPCIEVIRFFYLGSSELARRLFAGKAADGHSDIMDMSRSCYAPESGYDLYLADGLPNSDARMIAPWLSSAFALEEARRIHTSVSMAVGDGNLRAVKAFPPFEGKGRLKVQGIALTGAPRGDFLVLRILSGSYPLPHRYIRVHRDVSWKRPEIEVSKATQRGTESSPDNEDRPMSLLPDVEPTNTVKAQETVIEKSIDEKAWIQIIRHRIKTGEQTKARDRTSNDRPQSEPRGSRELATGEGVSDRASPRRLLVATEENEIKLLQAIPPGESGPFESLFHHLDEYCQGKTACWSLVGLSGASVTSPRGPLNILSRQWFDTALAWRYADAKSCRLRRVALVRLEIDNRVQFLVEFERRTYEALTTLLAYPRKKVSLQSRDFIALLVYAAQQRGIWSTADEISPPDAVHEKFVVKSWKHSWQSAKNAIERFAARIETINSVL